MNKEKQLYQEVAAACVTPARFAKPAMEAVVLELPEVARVYEMPPFRRPGAGSGA